MAQKSQFSSNMADLLIPLAGLLLGVGNVWFVDSGATGNSDSSGAGRTVSNPFATLGFALGQTTPSNGDIVFVHPGHTETISAADGIRFGTSAVGVQVIGIGVGLTRPTFNFTSVTTADMEIDAASVVLRNLYFDLTGIDALVAAIDVNASNFQMIGCEFLQADSGGQALVAVDLDGNADDSRISNCKFMAETAGDSNGAIQITGTLSGLEIDNCWIDGDYDDACIFSTVAFTEGLIRECYLRNQLTGQHSIEFTAAATGMLVNNRYHNDLTQATGVDPGSMFSFECYHDDVVDTSGILTPVAT
ncbi:MAG: hypothetical protein V3S55_09380 [Nitrospiraceae bacterium]